MRMSSEGVKQLFVGLPSSGKTTFLAALWHVAESGEVPSSLQVSQVTGLRDHLNKIRGQWLSCEEIDRTKIPAERTVSLKLRNPYTSHETELWLPDLSGETFRLQWETRQWSVEFDALAGDSLGALLFIHPKCVFEPGRIDTSIDRMADVLGAVTDVRIDDVTPLPWTPDKSPTQVKLVELVQFLKARPFSGRALRLAVIISAWDLVMQGERPEIWLQKRLPLLFQYLAANVEVIPFRIYGVSAQGGDLSSQATELQRLVKPSERIRVDGPEAEAHDITAPIRWVMEWQGP
jgi:hypothetical protein